MGTDALDRNFVYDALNRLVSATGRESDTQGASYLWNDAPVPGSPNASNVRTYDYDEMGNILELIHTANSNNFTRAFEYVTGKNMLDKITDGQSPASTLSDFTFDSNGNTILSNTTRNYEWDHVNNLRAYYNQTGTSEPTIFAHYLYDGSGNRTKKLVRTQGGNYEITVYIDGVFEYHKKVAGTTYEKNYVHVMDNQSRIATVRAGTAFPDDIADAVFYTIDDHLGTSNLRLSTTGSTIDREEYYPFGDSSLRTWSKKRYRYVGREKDLESGLYYYGAPGRVGL